MIRIPVLGRGILFVLLSVMILLLVGVVDAALLLKKQNPTTAKKLEKFTAKYTIDTIPGAVPPLGIFDPLKLGYRADENTLKRYREAEIIHGRVAMLATVGFIVGEYVEGSSFLFDSTITGPAIVHPFQVPAPFWTTLVFGISYFELQRAEMGWVDPIDVPFAQPGLLRSTYEPGNIGFDPFKLRPKPSKIKEYETLQTKEIQNGRLAMIASAGFLAQEAVDKQGIVEHFQNNYLL